MFLKAGALSLALLLASRLLGLVRESAQAAAFGTSGVADVVVLMLTLPDWLVGVMASGGLAYALLPAWALQTPAAEGRQPAPGGPCAAGRRCSAGRGARSLLRQQAAGWLALGPVRATGCPWRAARWCGARWRCPLALLASLWSTRLQHDSDFVGMYGANLVVNVTLILALVVVGLWGRDSPVVWLGARAGLQHGVAPGLAVAAPAA